MSGPDLVTGPDVEATTRERTRRRWRVGFGLAVVVHLVVLYWPFSPSTGGLPIDKVVHAVIFGMVLWAAAEAGLRVGPVALVLAAHAVLSELIQHYLLTGRSGDPADSVADVTGVVIVTLILRRRR